MRMVLRNYRWSRYDTPCWAPRRNFSATARIAALAGEFDEAEHLLTTGAFLSTLLPIIVFFALQRFCHRILGGAVKG